MSSVRLDPLTNDNLATVFDLRVAPGQENFVATNPWSLAQALVEYHVAWPRAIVAAEEVVGFLMLEIDPEEPDGRSFYLWRLMIGADHQRRGHGRLALDLAVEEVRRRAGTDLYTSWVPEEGGPEPFYLRYGFEPTGEIDDGEVVARLELSGSSPQTD